LIERVDGGSLAGTWKKGANKLPIALKRLELKEKESPCASMLFQGPRLEGVRTIKKPAMKDGVSYTRLILDHRGHFDKDIQVESFALNEEGPAAHAINAELRKQLNGVDSWFECIRMAWDLGSDGYTGQTIFPRMISKRWLVVMDENGWFCGGAHHDDANTPHLFDRLTGKEVDALQWFNAKAVKREKFEGDPDPAEMLQRLVEEVVLHHAQDPVVAHRGVDHPLRARHVVRHRLLEVHVPARVEQLDHAVLVQRDRQQRLHRVHLEAARGELGRRRERGCVGPVGLPLRATVGVGIDERDHVDVVVAHVAAHVQVVDPAEPHACGAHRTVVRLEAHDTTAAGASCSMNSRRIPPGASTNAMRRRPKVPSTISGPQTTA